MKVLLIQPPIEDFYDTSIRTYPLNLLYVAARVKNLCDVSVVDLRTGRKRTRPFPEQYQGLTPFYRDDTYTPFSLFRRYYRFGATRDEIRTTIRNEAPSIVGISASYTTYSMEALEVARIAKEVDADIVTVMGGTHATLFPQHLLKHSFVDYVIRGEGETPFAWLVEMLQKGADPRSNPIHGVSFRNENHFHVSEINVEKEIDLLPYRRDLSPEMYRINKKKYAFMLTSRGCPFACRFCGKPPVPYRKRDLASIEREIDDCVGLGIEAVDFEDDMLNLDKPFFAKVLELACDKNLTLSAMNGIYPETIDIPLLESMHAAGFQRLNFSLVDAAESVLEKQARSLPKAFLEILSWLESSPFLVETHFIIGLPGQRPEDVLDTLVFLMGKRLLLGPSIFYLAPGSETFQQIMGDDWESYVKLMRSSAMYPANPLFPRETTYTLMKLVRFINYVKQAVDRSSDMRFVSELAEALPADKTYEREIVRRLVKEKLLTWYVLNEQILREEPQDLDLIRLFFNKARGLSIRGFKTNNSVKVDV